MQKLLTESNAENEYLKTNNINLSIKLETLQKDISTQK